MKSKYSAALVASLVVAGSLLAGSPAGASQGLPGVPAEQAIDRSPVHRAATAADFPVRPEVGKSVTVKQGAKEITVAQVTATCSMSYTVGTPYKANNRIYSYANVSRSSGCTGSESAYGYLYGTNWAGGETLAATNGATLQPGTAAYLPLITNVCTYGWDSGWRSTTGAFTGVSSATVTLPCRF